MTFPGLLEYQSKKLCNQIYGSSTAYITPYTNWYCHNYFVWFGILFSIGAFGAALYSAVIGA